MNIRFEVITFKQVQEVLAHGQSHWEEAGLSHLYPEFNLDAEKYKILDRIGKLSIVVAKDGDNVIGYSADILDRHPHCDEPAGLNDAFYVHPAYRKLGVPDMLNRFVKDHLKSLGIKIHILSMTSQKKFTDFMDRNNYKELETNYYSEL